MKMAAAYSKFGGFNTSDWYEFAYMTAQTKRIGGQEAQESMSRLYRLFSALMERWRERSARFTHAFLEMGFSATSISLRPAPGCWWVAWLTTTMMQ
jgi:hypothetical protein